MITYLTMVHLLIFLRCCTGSFTEVMDLNNGWNTDFHVPCKWKKTITALRSCHWIRSK